jgi:dsDNA-specific endonuclease/ATPase MutS2
MKEIMLKSVKLPSGETIAYREAGKGTQQIILIHGNGKGILRNELLKLLKKNFSTYKITDASMQKYGTGAIEVQIT